MKKINFTFIISLSLLFFASCSTTLERKIHPSSGNWNPIASKSKIDNSKRIIPQTIVQASGDKSNVFTNSDSNLTVTPVIVEFKTSKSSENVGQKSTNNILNKSEIKSLKYKVNLLKPVKSIFIKKFNSINKNYRSLSSSSNGGNGFSIAALVIGILGLFVLGWLFGPLAIIFGAIGMSRGGRGMAIAGLILGILDLILWLVLFLLVLSTL